MKIDMPNKKPLAALIKEMCAAADPTKAKVMQGFFKTAKGQYGYGDIFIGLTVPAQREIAKKYLHLPLADLRKLLSSKIHEHRLTALMILVYQYQKNLLSKKRAIDFYLRNIKFINNWDLVDASAPYILGDYFLDKSKTPLYKLAKSKSLWERRIAIVATLGLIRKGQYDATLKIAGQLLADQQDLIHKATGWMLREIGKKSLQHEIKFLEQHASRMPRTTLRYAIERFPEKLRRFYLLKKTGI